jgi:hypothetical protein
MAATPEYVSRLRDRVNAAMPALLALGDVASAKRPAPGRWSPREIIGHLIDSASNNHGRFVRGQLQDELVFPGYAQDRWVEVQRYQDAPWAELVELWGRFNLQIARVMDSTPEDIRLRPRISHNFHQIGFVTIAPDRPATLDHLMRDYVDHLEHHLRQIVGT